MRLTFLVLIASVATVESAPAQAELSDFIQSIRKLNDAFQNIAAEYDIVTTQSGKELLKGGRSLPVERATFCICVTEGKAFVSQQEQLTGSGKVKSRTRQALWLKDGLGYSCTFSDRKFDRDSLYCASGEQFRDAVLKQIATVPYDGLWNDWQFLPAEIDEYLTTEGGGERITFLADRKDVSEWRNEDKYGITKIQIERFAGKYFVVGISTTKTGSSILRRGSTNRVEGLLTKFGSCQGNARIEVVHEYFFSYSKNAAYPDKFRIICTKRSAERDCDDIVSYEYTVRKFTKLISPEAFDFCDCKNSQLAIPNGSRVLPTDDSLHHIDLEWQDGRIVKSIDKQTLDVSAQAKVEPPRRWLLLSRWGILVGAIVFLGIVIRLRAIWRRGIL